MNAIPASLSSLSAKRLQSFAALLVMVVALSLCTDRFLTTENGVNILRQISINLCLSIGMTFVIICGGIDLSVGAVLALAGAIAAQLVKSGLSLGFLGVHLDFTLCGALIAALATGAVVGLGNGLVITRLALPPFVATLATMGIARGLCLLYTGGFPITGLGEQFGQIGTGAWLFVPVPVWIVAGLGLVSIVICHRTAFGRHLYAVGGSERAARLTGLNVQGIKTTVYLLCGALSGLAGALVSARLDSAQPNAGVGYELDSIAAVVIGGTSLSGGTGSVAGTLIGCLIIGVLNNGLTLLNVSPFWQEIVKGAVILLAVAVDRAGVRRNRGT